MLLSLSIRNIVLIDALDLGFEDGLVTLTGETGAGKSILLDSLGLATGARADKGLVRHGAEEGTVTALFHPPAEHPVFALLREAGVEVGEESEVILRRVQSGDGRSRAFVNDQPVSVGLLARIGETLVEVHGQHDERGLLNPAGHRALLDAYGGYGAALSAVRGAFAAWETARASLERHKAGIAQAAADQDYLTHVLKELDDLSPEVGEEETLAARRTLMMNAEKIADDLNEALRALTQDGGMEGRLNVALRRLERAAPQAEKRLDNAVGALERALLEAGEARHALEAAVANLDFDARELERAEERLFALRALARKHKVPADELPALQERFAERLADLARGEDRLAELDAAERAAHQAYEAAAKALTRARTQAADRLDKAVMAELAPLKLERAQFRTRIDALEPERWGAEGADRVRFEIATNPGAPFGDLAQIASGGEMARFVLALKVALAGEGTAGTLVFDEVDRGVGGAVADAVGERLARLAAHDNTQVLVVTHSPQVAARGVRQFRIAKALENDAMLTRVALLDEDGRREEIARMLAGAEITQEARAAADRLLGLAQSTGEAKGGRKKAAGKSSATGSSTTKAKKAAKRA